MFVIELNGGTVQKVEYQSETLKETSPKYDWKKENLASEKSGRKFKLRRIIIG